MTRENRNHKALLVKNISTFYIKDTSRKNFNNLFMDNLVFAAILCVTRKQIKPIFSFILAKARYECLKKSLSANTWCRLARRKPKKFQNSCSSMWWTGFSEMVHMNMFTWTFYWLLTRIYPPNFKKNPMSQLFHNFL